jgi:hypothetical protein
LAILLPTLLISVVQIGLFTVCGVGLTRLTLPRRLLPYELLLAPLVGLALLAVSGFYAANAGLTMRQLLPLVLLLALLLLAVALHREWRLGERRWWPGVPPLRELLPLVLLLAATWLLNIAPLLTYGTLIPIGDNWDVEFYLPLADYLKDYSYLTLSQAPANPLRDLLLTERLSARAMGATYAQAMADLLVYREAWDSWVPMLAVLRLLTLAGLYALLRGGLQVRPAGALAGVALAGLNSLLLWTTYNSFGMSTGGLALLPAALLLLLFALEEGRSRVLFGAAFLLAGLTCTYWPMLMAYGAAGLGIGLAVLAESRAKAQRRKGPGRMELFPGRGEDSEMRGGSGGKSASPSRPSSPGPFSLGEKGRSVAPLPQGEGFGVRAMPGEKGNPQGEGFGVRATPGGEKQMSASWRSVVGRGVLVLAGGGLLALLVHLRATTAFVGMFLAQTPSMGVAEFLSPAVILGSAPFSHRGLNPFSPLQTALVWGGSITAVVLLVLAIWRGVARRGVAVGILLCVLAYLLGLRFVVGYPYGLLRGSSYVNTLLLALIGAGVLLDTPAQSSRFAWLRPVTSLLFVLLLASSGWATFATYQVYAERPGVYGLETVGMRSAVAGMEEGSAVQVSSAPELRGPLMGAWAYALRQQELLGVMATGYQPLVHMREGAAHAYALLHRGEDPRAYGMEPAALVWQDDRAALYAAPPARVSWLSGRRNFYSEGSLLLNNTTWTRAQAGVGSHRQAQDGAPLTVSATDTLLTYEPAGEPSVKQDNSSNLPGRTLQIALASFAEQQAKLVVGDEQYSLDIPAGLSLVRTEPFATPQQVELRATTAPLFVYWLGLDDVARTPNPSPQGRGATELPFSPREDSVGKHHLLPGPLRLCAFARGPARTFPTESRKKGTGDEGRREEKSESLVSAPAAMDDTMLVGLRNTPQADGTVLQLQVANPGQHMLRFAVEIYEEVPGYDITPAHYAWTLFPAPLTGTHELTLDVQTPAMRLNGAPLSVEQGELRDGNYFAALWVYQGEQVRRVLPFLRFARVDGVVVDVVPLDVNVAFTRLLPPAQPLEATFANGINLRGVELARQQVQPGGQLRVSFRWHPDQPQPPQPWLLFVQVLDAQDRQIANWTGAAGGDWYPTPAWQPGQRIWQDVPLDIAQDAPAGTYRVIAGLFDPASGERLRLQDGADMLVVGEVVVAQE